MIGPVQSNGLILFAHGARDPRWAEPFLRLLGCVREKRPSLPVALAFLDYLEPNLMTAVQGLVQQRVDHIRVVPLFFGRGGHLREDLPHQLDAVRNAVPHVHFDIAEAAGEADSVLDALADFALSNID